jgi:hypothetical protein
MGDASGSVVVTDHWVFAGAYGADFPSESGGNLVFAFARTTVDAALNGTAIDGASEGVTRLTMPSDFQWVGSRFVAFNWTTMEFDAYLMVMPAADPPSIFTVQRFVDGTVFPAVTRVGEHHALLAHEHGMLLVHVP